MYSSNDLDATQADAQYGVAVRGRRGPRSLRRWVLGVCAALLLMCWPMRGNAQTVVATLGSLSTGQSPYAVTVNTVTNFIYVAKRFGSLGSMACGSGGCRRSAFHGSCVDLAPT